MSLILHLDPFLQLIKIMLRKRGVLLCICMHLCIGQASAQTTHDSKDSNINTFFKKAGSKYFISFHHVFEDTLWLPHGCELAFEGGSLSGPIVMNKTKLSGRVNLKGASLSGSISNSQFDASWLCAMDGVTDDAKSINEMIEVCGKVFFPKGTYRLVSRYNPEGRIPKKLHKAITTHIGICKSDVELIGEDGTNFVTDDSLSTICLFSKPKQIAKSIRNIKIKNITFNVHNDGVNFHEFLHTIKTIGVNGLEIEHCTFNDFWGDAICLSHYGDNPKTGERTRNQNIKILGNTINGDSHNNRNGISVINGKNVLIKGNIIKNTSRKNMPGGIDVEPNNKAYTIENIRIEKNYIEGVPSHAITVYIKKDGPAHHIEILSNEIKGCGKAGIAVAINTEDTTDSIIVQNNHVFADTKPYLFRGKGCSKDWIISGNTFERPVFQSMPGDIKVDNLLVKNNKKKRLIDWIAEEYTYGFLLFLFIIIFLTGLFIMLNNKSGHYHRKYQRNKL